VTNIFRNGIKGAQTRVVGSALAKSSIGIQLVVMLPPKERATSREGRIMPNMRGKSIIIQLGEGVANGSGERRGEEISDMAVVTAVSRQLNVRNQGRKGGKLLCSIYPAIS